jgi:hypothetical protein
MGAKVNLMLLFLPTPGFKKLCCAAFLLFFCLDTKEPKNQGRNDGGPFLPYSYARLLYYCSINICNPTLKFKGVNWYHIQPNDLNRKEVEIKLKYLHPKNRITDVQFTVVQMMHIAASDKRGVIVCRAPFLVLFWRSKKEQ